jgi:hypothetical protein
LAKLDKSQYTKEEWIKVRDERRARKANDKRIKILAQDSQKNKSIKSVVQPPITFNHKTKNKIAFIIGNGNSRKDLDITDLSDKGTIYGCNALYREFEPDHLIAVDTKMILEINKAGYQHSHSVWTNSNRAFNGMNGFNFFNPSKGWSSGPTALWFASTHDITDIYILGFDYQGIDNKINNVYSDTPNYKKSHERATYYGNWLRQTCITCQKFSEKRYIRVLGENGFIPPEFSKIDNLVHITVEEFKKSFNIS